MSVGFVQRLPQCGTEALSKQLRAGLVYARPTIKPNRTGILIAVLGHVLVTAFFSRHLVTEAATCPGKPALAMPMDPAESISVRAV